MPSPSTSFGTAADDYERGRPGYPDDAVAWVTGPAPLRVLDLGAGTGKLTAALAGAGHDVVAVDPDPAMLEVLAGALPAVAARQGRAEAIPVGDESVDVVTVAQAWHWMDVGAASAELARALRPGGALGLVWNIRDDSIPWVADLTVAMHGSAAERLIDEDGVTVGAPFGVIERANWRWTRAMTRADLQAMVRSRSHYIAANPAARARIDGDVARVLDSAPHLDDGRIPLPYVTHAYRATRP